MLLLAYYGSYTSIYKKPYLNEKKIRIENYLLLTHVYI